MGEARDGSFEISHGATLDPPGQGVDQDNQVRRGISSIYRRLVSLLSIGYRRGKEAASVDFFIFTSMYVDIPPWQQPRNRLIGNMCPLPVNVNKYLVDASAPFRHLRIPQLFAVTAGQPLEP